MGPVGADDQILKESVTDFPRGEFVSAEGFIEGAQGCARLRGADIEGFSLHFEFALIHPMGPVWVGDVAGPCGEVDRSKWRADDLQGLPVGILQFHPCALQLPGSRDVVEVETR